jgi:D-sedoheptulose 7-phosphate isomerase
MREDIERYWYELAGVAHRMPFESLGEAAEELLACRARRGTVFVVGNGGSAATASHFACDLAKGTRTPGVPPFRVVALTDSVPLLTAWANDTSYDRVFAEQLATLVRPGDVVVAISASGNSENVLAVVEVAREGGATTIALTGATGGRLRRLVDVVVLVPAAPIEQVEDAHLAVAHSVCVALRTRLVAEAAAPALESALTVTARADVAPVSASA